MSLYVWYTGKTNITGKELGKAFNTRFSRNPPNRITQRYVTILNWGNSKRINHNGSIINPPEAVGNASNKLRALQIMKENGVSVPTFCSVNRVYDELKSGSLRFPIIGRKISHTAGSGFEMCIQKNDIKTAINNGVDYFMNFVRTEREFRVHVFDRRIIRLSEKIPDINSPERDKWIRSVRKGWTFTGGTDISYSTPRMVRIEAKNAVEALNLDFGAVDILLSEGKNIYVLEVNTGPSLNERGIELYKNAIETFITGL